MPLPDASFYNLSGDVADAYSAISAILNTHVHSIRVEDLSNVRTIGLSNGVVLAYDAPSATWRVTNQAATATRAYVDEKIMDVLANNLKVQ